jgi:hypothetical protein
MEKPKWDLPLTVIAQLHNKPMAAFTALKPSPDIYGKR